jgi:F-type H+-transporting ATPase subunit delta
MRGTSRASLAAAKERLTAALVGDAAGSGSELGDELFAVTSLLDRDPGLCRSLSDPSRDAEARSALAADLLQGKISAAGLAQVVGLVSGHWSSAGELADAAEQLAVLAIAEAADDQGQLDELEDELFRFSRVVQANPALRSALSHQFVPAERKRELVQALVGGKVTEPALRLMNQAVSLPRSRSLDAALEFYANLAAEQRERLVAEVHVAIALTDSQHARLAAALAAAYGHEVHLNVVLDPEIVGGMSVRIGPELINGSVASHLADLRRRLAV